MPSEGSGARIAAAFVDSTALVGNTPLVRLNTLPRDAAPGAEVWAKLEQRNPMGSVKDRIGLAMVEAAEREGRIRRGDTLVEATSGNTGIALAFVGAIRGYRVILTMPQGMSAERRRLLRALGAQLVLTDAHLGMSGAVAEAQRIEATSARAVWLRQFENPANPEAHYRGTGPEIWRDCAGKVDAFVAGVGTGGTITGVGRYLKERNAAIRLVAVEPAESPVLSGGQPAPHPIQGIGAGFVPAVLDTASLDEVLPVHGRDAGSTARTLAAREGIVAGVSAGANVWAAYQLARRPEYAGKRIVTIICDTGERYLSTWLYDEEDIV